MPLSLLDVAGLLKTGERLHDLGWYDRTLLVSARAQVLNVDQEPIPRLSEADDLGCALTFWSREHTRRIDSTVFDRIAGKNAAAEEPWE